MEQAAELELDKFKESVVVGQRLYKVKMIVATVIALVLAVLFGIMMIMVSESNHNKNLPGAAVKWVNANGGTYIVTADPKTFLWVMPATNTITVCVLNDEGTPNCSPGKD